MVCRCQPIPPHWKAGLHWPEERILSEVERIALSCLTPYFVNLEDGWLSPSSEFRSFSAVLLTPFSFSFSLTLLYLKHLLLRLGFVNMMREVGWVQKQSGEDCDKPEVPLSVSGGKLGLSSS